MKSPSDPGESLQQKIRAALAPLVGKKIVPEIRDQMTAFLLDSLQGILDSHNPKAKDLLRMPTGVHCANGKCKATKGRVKVDLAGTTVSVVCADCGGQKWTQPSVTYTWTISKKEPSHD